MKQNRSIVIAFIMSILFMISFILAANLATAQFKNIPNFENFIGTWEYKTDSEHFILKTKTYNYTYGSKTYYLVLGVYKYVKDSVVIYDFLDKFKECMRSDKYVIVMGAWDDLPDNIPQTKLHIYYRELSNTIYTTKAWHSPLIYIPGNPAQLSWHIEQDECIEEIVEDEETETQTQTSNTISAPIRDVIILEERPDLNPFTIPVNMILTKVEE